MTDPLHAAARDGYTRQARAYERGRPDYPRALDDWLRDALRAGPGTTVADVGAGTGKFTARLCATGAQVVAVEPVDAMRERIETALPQVRALAGTAQSLPLDDTSVDIVVCAQAYHWFASRESLDEFARVLPPGGRLGLVWNVRDESVDWVAALTRIMAPYEAGVPRYGSGRWRTTFPHPAFGPLAETMLAHGHDGPPEHVIVDRVLSTSFIAALPPAQQDAVRDEVRALIGSHPALRGRDEVHYPYRTHACVAVRV